jgi:hypothetical protein
MSTCSLGKGRGKKAKKKYVQVPGFGQKMYYFTFSGILSYSDKIWFKIEVCPLVKNV